MDHIPDLPKALRAEDVEEWRERREEGLGWDSASSSLPGPDNIIVKLNILIRILPSDEVKVPEP